MLAALRGESLRAAWMRMAEVAGPRRLLLSRFDFTAEACAEASTMRRWRVVGKARGAPDRCCARRLGFCGSAAARFKQGASWMTVFCSAWRVLPRGNIHRACGYGSPCRRPSRCRTWASSGGASIILAAPRCESLRAAWMRMAEVAGPCRLLLLSRFDFTSEAWAEASTMRRWRVVRKARGAPDRCCARRLGFCGSAAARFKQGASWIPVFYSAWKVRPRGHIHRARG